MMKRACIPARLAARRFLVATVKYKSSVPGLAGWPSFSEIAAAGAVRLENDDSQGMHRIEAICRKCGSHLGHVFDDNESRTGKHFCINSACLSFEPKAKN